jgi:uncharacterized protein (DUF3084 family)
MGENNANLLEDIKATNKNLTLDHEAISKAHNSFASHYNEFLTLAERLENKFKELEARENAVEKREKEVNNKEQQLQERERKCGEIEKKIEKWSQMEIQMQHNAAKVPNIIKLNIGKNSKNYSILLFFFRGKKFCSYQG